MHHNPCCPPEVIKTLSHSLCLSLLYFTCLQTSCKWRHIVCIFCDNYFSQNILFYVILITISRLLLIVSVRYLGTHDLFITFNNIPALRVSGYIEWVRFLRGLACYCTFWRYTVLTSSETWSKHNFSVFLRTPQDVQCLLTRLPSRALFPSDPRGHVPSGALRAGLAPLRLCQHMPSEGSSVPSGTHKRSMSPHVPRGKGWVSSEHTEQVLSLPSPSSGRLPLDPHGR